MYNLQDFKKFFMDKYAAMSVKGETNDFLDEALTAPNLYVCFEKVFDAINNVKDITDPVSKAKFIQLDDILLLFKALNKSNSSDVELQRLLDNAISRFDHKPESKDMKFMLGLIKKYNFTNEDIIINEYKSYLEDKVSNPM